MTSAEPWRVKVEAKGRLAGATTALVQGFVISAWVLRVQGEFGLMFVVAITIPLVVFNLWFVLWITDPQPELRRRWRLPRLRKMTLEDVATVTIDNLNEPQERDDG